MTIKELKKKTQEYTMAILCIAMIFSIAIASFVNSTVAVSVFGMVISFGFLVQIILFNKYEKELKPSSKWEELKIENMKISRSIFYIFFAISFGASLILLVLSLLGLI